MNEATDRITVDALAVGMTRPAMRWGVTYAALIANGVFSMELFLLTHNLLLLSVALPIHGLCVLVCSREPRWFELAALWLRHRVPALLHNYRYWRASSYSPLTIVLPRSLGRKRQMPEMYL